MLLMPLLVAVLAIGAAAQTKLPASGIKTIYIVPTSHYDLGFVEPPDAVRERAARHIDEVIRVGESDPDFRWTIESVWQVNEWLKRQKKATSVLPMDKEKIGRLMALIKSGRVMLSTSWGSMHTDFMGEEEINRLTSDFARLERLHGITSETALMDDVPGHPTTIPGVLAGSGTNYLVTGANLFIQPATSLAPGNVPFYWQGPDGNKVLTWVSQSNRGGYTEGMTDFYLDPYSLDPYTGKTPFDMFNPALAGKKTPLEVMEIGITELLNRYGKAGYKYDAVMAMYAHDFVEPTNVRNLEKAVEMWNAQHPEVRLKIATPVEFFKYIEGKYGPQLPTASGEWSGLWSESKTQSPRISALARYAHDHTPAAETLWSAIAMTRRIPFPVGNFTGLYESQFTYDEHSGAGNNGWIQLNRRDWLDEQNRQYVNLMSGAAGEAEFLLNQGISVATQPTRFDTVKTRPTADSRNLLVYNGLSRDRDDVVRFEHPNTGMQVTQITDVGTGKPVDFDVDGDGRIVFTAHSVPSFGYRTFEVRSAPGSAVTTLKTIAGQSVEFGGFQVRMRPDGSILGIRDIKRGREIVNENGEMEFNELLRVEGTDASRISYPVAPKITVCRGRQMAEIRVERARSAFPLTVITIHAGLDRVEIRNELDPDAMPFVGGSGNWHDSYYFAFPFNISKDGLKIKRGGQKWFDTLPDDYLPGARTDAVTTQHLIGLTDGASSALLAHREAFHWVYASYVDTKIRPKNEPKGFPAMFTGKFPLPEATVYSRAVRRSNQADTADAGVVNMRTVEPGLTGRYVYNYAVAADGSFDAVRARMLGADFNVPLLARFNDGIPAPTESFFGIDQPNVEIVAVTSASVDVAHGEVSATPLDPQLTKAFVIRLQEFAGRAVTANVRLPVIVKKASVVNLTESRVIGEIQSAAPLRISLQPFETKTVRIEIE